MSLKSLSKTRWAVDPGQIRIYPFGIGYILAAVLAIIFAGLYGIYHYYLKTSLMDSIPIIVVLLLTVFVFVAWAGTVIEFDLSAGVVRRKILGILPVSSLHFSKIHGINPVSNMMGSYRYRLFKKDNRYGKGMLVSCSYSKNDDPNAIAFVDEVVTPVHKGLEFYDKPSDFVSNRIDNYEFFKVESDQYILKQNRVGSLVFGLVLLAIGIHELTPSAWLGLDWTVGRVCFLLFTLIGGPAIILSAFTRTIFDRQSKTLSRSNPLRLANKSFAFEDFSGLQTVRKSTNFIYSGTDVQIYFLKPGAAKEDVIILSSFYSTKKVERFISEVNSIIHPA